MEEAIRRQNNQKWVFSGLNFKMLKKIPKTTLHQHRNSLSMKKAWYSKNGKILKSGRNCHFEFILGVKTCLMDDVKQRIQRIKRPLSNSQSSARANETKKNSQVLRGKSLVKAIVRQNGLNLLIFGWNLKCENHSKNDTKTILLLFSEKESQKKPEDWKWQHFEKWQKKRL